MLLTSYQTGTQRPDSLSLKYRPRHYDVIRTKAFGQAIRCNLFVEWPGYNVLAGIGFLICAHDLPSILFVHTSSSYEKISAQGI
jgi:hypothetical protein